MQGHNSTLLLFNARSVVRKWYSICHAIDLYKAAVVVITETWLSTDVDSNVYTYKNYSKFVSHRAGRTGGGVICLVKPEYKASALPMPAVFPATCDGLLVKIHSLSLVLCACYQPPSCSVNDSTDLISAFESVLELSFDTTILGDLNLPGIHWGSEPVLGHSALDEWLIELCSAWDMTQLVSQPTRGEHILDIIMTTVPAIHTGCRVESPISTSDHCTIICSISAPPRIKQSTSSCVLDFRRADFNLINQMLFDVDWVGLLSHNNDINANWSCFANIVSDVIQCAVPLVDRHSAPVAGRHRALFLRKKRRWKKYKRKPTQKNKDAFKKATRQLSAAISFHRFNEEAALLRKSPKAFYIYVSQRCHPSNQQITLKDGDNVVSVDVSVYKLLACEFSKNFSSAFETFVPIGSSVESTFQLNISAYSVHSGLKLLPDTAAGPDGIPAMFYKGAANSLARPLSIIFNRSLLQGCVPKDWKLAKVIPLYKGKDCRDASSSYRPISLTNVTCKVMETLIVVELTHYLESKNLLAHCQHGFRRGRSTVTNLLECDAFIWQCLYNKRCCDVICIDFMRAFDKVSHSLLFKKLKEAGIDGCYLRWFADFLTDRWQYFPRLHLSIRCCPGLLRWTIAV